MHGAGSAVFVLGLVLVAVAVGSFAERVRLPSPVLLVVLGICVGLIPGVGPVDPTPELVGALVLPPLLYSSALDIPIRELRRVAGQVTGLAVGLVLLTVLVVGLVAHATVPGMGLSTALLLGALLSSVDPVAVAALSRQMHLPRRLQTIVQSESLLNDATSLVVFKVLVAIVAAGGGASVGDVAGRLLLLAGGGTAIGVAVGAVAVFVRRRLHDLDGEGVFALATPFAAYLLAETAHASGVTAVVVCGLFIGPRLPLFVTSSIRLREQAVLGVVVFALEGIVFGLIGLVLPSLVRSLPDGVPSSLLGPTALVLLAVVVARAVWVYPSAYLPGLFRRAESRPGWQQPALLSWAGTRGVVALTAALSLPTNKDDGSPLPFRAELLVITVSVIVVTLVAQGLTLAPLASRLGVRGDPLADRAETHLAQSRAARVALAHLEELLDEGRVDPAVVGTLHAVLERRVDVTRQNLKAPDRHVTADPERSYRRIRRDLVDVQRTEVLRLQDTGEVSHRVGADVIRGLDLEAAALDR